MEDIFTRILDKGTAPSREDIALLLASIGKPGEKTREKDAAVSKLFEEGGFASANFQGHPIDLTTYGEY